MPVPLPTAKPLPTATLVPTVAPSPTVLPSPTPTLTSTLLAQHTATPSPKPDLAKLAEFPIGDLIAFISTRDGTTKIYLTAADGSIVAPLTDLEANGPAWSSDGRTIAFNCAADICAVNVDGSDLINLTNTPWPGISEANPIWSPDGEMIAFMRKAGEYHDIYVMNADGTNQRKLSSTAYQNQDPVWSSDGKKLAYMNEIVNVTSIIYTVNVDGSELVALNDAGPENRAFGPAFSPDSQWITFTSYHEGKLEVYKSRPDGSDLTLLTNGASLISAEVQWSPDGLHIAFQSHRDGVQFQETYIMRSDGTEQMRLTRHGIVNGIGSWSSDGTRLAFVSRRDGLPEIYVINIDGTQEYNLTNDPEADGGPVWQPGLVHETIPLTPTPSTTLTPTTPVIVTFPDANLDAAIRGALGKPPGEEITAAELAGIATLNANNRRIANLKGIEHAINLTNLNLQENQIIDISHLTSLTILTEVDLAANQISNISALASLTNLTWLHLGFNRINGISPLTSLTNLANLDLNNSQINDISPLVENNGLGEGDEVWLEGNNLDLWVGSEDQENIRQLQERGVVVHY